MSRRKKPTQKVITVEVTATGPLTAGVPEATHGWGEGGQEVEVTGPVAQILVRRGKDAVFSVRVLEDGSLILTNYGSNYTTMADRNLRLTNTVPWPEE